MWSQDTNTRKSRIALQLHNNPLRKKMSLRINDEMICETDFSNRDERKMILLNWEEKYSLFEQDRYSISISA